MKIAKKTLLLCSALVLFTPMSSPMAKDATQDVTAQTIRMAPLSFADLAETLSPAVVNISTTQKAVIRQDLPALPQFPQGSPFQDFFEDFMQQQRSIPSRPSSSLGSGFVIDAENGYIITNNHVIRDADEVRVTFADDTSLDAEIIGTDEKTDLAVLKVDTTDVTLTAVSFGDSDHLRVGDWTLAIGNPFGLGGTVTAGILSARARDIQSGPYDDYLQTDASINRGNSGGPLFDMQGNVIGINTAIFSPTGGSVGIGFAIPSALAEPVIDQIIKYGRTRRGWLGVRIQSVTDEIAESLGLEQSQGALIAGVNDDGPAAKAGLKAGDIILEFGEREVADMRALPRIVAEHDINADAEIVYWRDGKKKKTRVKVGELEKAEESGLLNETTASAQGVTIAPLNLTVNAVTDEARRLYNLGNVARGIVITDVGDGSEAARKNIRAGQIITEINQQAVQTPADVQKIVDRAIADGRKSVLLLLSEGRRFRFVALRVAE